MLLRLTLIVCCVLLTACAGPRAHQSGTAVTKFTSAASLHEIARKSQGAAAPGLTFGGVDRWELSVASTQATPEETKLTALAPELAARTKSTASASLSCVAHELARVLAEHGALPTQSVRRFIAGRCGAWVTPAAQTWIMPLTRYANLANVAEEARAMLASLTPSQLGIAAGMQMGLGAARSAERLALVATFVQPTVELESLARFAAADGTVTVRGRLTQKAWLAEAHINQGALGVRKCTFDPAFALPTFSVTCTMADGDDHAWLQMMAVPPGRLLGNSVLEVLALRNADAARSYQPPAESELAPAQDPKAFHANTLTALNQTRAKAGLAPLAYTAEQSAIASKVTVPFFESMLASGSEADSVNNTITLGLLAGWDVQGGTIQSAQLCGALSDVPKDPGRWLAATLELPSGRAVLLDPSSSTVALGIEMAPEGVAGVAVTYGFTNPQQDFRALTLDVLHRLKLVRDARRLGDTIFVSDTPGMEAALRRIQTHAETPHQAIGGVLELTAEAIGRGVQGFVWETYALEGIEFPPELLRQGDLYLGAGITQYKPDGAPWAQYAVLFAVIASK